MVTKPKVSRPRVESGRKKMGRPIGAKSKKSLSEFIEFTPDEVLKIIVACKKNEVGSFSYGGLKIGFGKELSQDGDIPTASMREVNEVVPGQAYPDEQLEALASKEYAQSRSITEDELAELQITDPAKAEQIMMGVGDA